VVLDLIKKFKIEVLQEWSSWRGLEACGQGGAVTRRSNAARAALDLPHTTNLAPSTYMLQP